jgi:hypothetical protein
MAPKTLVVILAQTRGHALTFDSFKQNVIDELDADLCLCIGVKNDYDYNNPYYKLAKYRFLYNEEDDPTFAKSVPYSYEKTIKERSDTANFRMNNNVMYERYVNINNLFGKISNPYHSCENIKHLGEFKREEDIDLSEFPENDAFIYHNHELCGVFNHQLYSINESDTNFTHDSRITTFLKHKHYTEFLKLKNKIMTENDDPTSFNDFTISTYIHVFFLWFLQQNIKQNDLLTKYDRIVILRSDYIYMLPFPKMELLDDEYIWIPFGEDHHGVCDRSVVLSNSNFNKYASILEHLYNWSNVYFQLIEQPRLVALNMEQILEMHLKQLGVYGLIRRYCNISYSVRGINDTTRWSAGVYNNDLGYYIKYPDEYTNSKLVKNHYEKSELSIYDFYKVNIPVRGT